MSAAGVEDGFPFTGYDDVLDRIVATASAPAGATVLDLGTGTDALAARFRGAGCAVVGVNRVALTAATLPQLERRFDRVVSAYAFHELRPTERRRLITNLFERHLVRGGVVVIGDISFPTAADHDRVRRALGRRWDDRELYLIADEEQAAFAELGLRTTYEPVSFCAGVFVLRA